MRVEFGDCVFDAETRELTRGSKAMHLSPKAFHVLEVLLENRPRVLPKAELHEKVWEGTFVSDATLASAIAEIREALGDTGKESKFLRTVHGFGYAFSGEGREVRREHFSGATDEFAYRLIWGGREIELREGENVLGREKGVAVWIDDPSVSRRHARINVRGDSVTLEDLKSKNGTYAGGVPVTSSSVVLLDATELQVGKVVLTFRAFPPIGSTATVSGTQRRPTTR